MSPLPPPAGGIASWTRRILSKGLGQCFVPVIVDTSIQQERKLFEGTKINSGEFFRTARILVQTVKHLRLQPTILHLNSCLSPMGIFRDLICVILSNIFAVPVVTHFRGDVSDFPRRKMFHLAGLALKQVIIRSDICIVLNKPSFQSVKELSEETEIIILPNFIEDEAFVANTARSMASGKTKVLFVGGITRSKGCSDIIEVAGRLPAIEFCLTGEIKADLKTTFRDLPPNVKINGPVDNKEILEEMLRNDIFFFPSHSEGFPNVVLEAMARALPVVATKVGAIPEMIEHGIGGFLVDTGAVDQMVDAIQKLSGNRELRTKMGELNRMRAMERYAFSVVVEDLTNIYSQLAKKHS